MHFPPVVAGIELLKTLRMTMGGWRQSRHAWAESLHHGCAQSNYVVGGDVYFILLVPREYVWRHEKMEL